MINNYLQQSLNSYLDKCKLIPWNFQPTKFYSVKFDAWNKMQIIHDDPTFNSLILVSRYALEGIILCYKDTHAFTEPHLSFMPDKGTWELRIGTMENELYEKLMENIKKKMKLYNLSSISLVKLKCPISMQYMGILTQHNKSYQT